VKKASASCGQSEQMPPFLIHALKSTIYWSYGGLLLLGFIALQVAMCTLCIGFTSDEQLMQMRPSYCCHRDRRRCGDSAHPAA
jgi:hypothetical protein